MSILKELNPQKGEVVRIKFKSINDLMDNINMPFHEVEEYYDLQNNIKAYIAGGDFLVDAAYSKDENSDDTYIEIKNHLDKTYCFPVHESAIVSIEIIESAETFVSNDLKIIAVRIGNEMYVNGHPMIWNESEQNEYSDKNKENHNRKLLRMFENFIADLAVQDSFQQLEEKEEG